jgi:hypothetical protein
VLAEWATAVTAEGLTGAASGDAAAAGVARGVAGNVAQADERGRSGTSGWTRIFPAVSPLDDAAFAPFERRVLLPVRDVGLAAVVRIAPDAGPVDVRIRVDGQAVRWRFTGPGRHACVAGRLDGHIVGATWPLAGNAAAPEPTDGGAARSGLPPAAPRTWDVVRPLGPATTEAADAVDHAAEPAATLLAIAIEGVPAAAVVEAAPREGATDALVVVESLTAWRDLLYRPAADGREEWRLGADEFLLLGDFPSGSRDSRHWGPLTRRSLLHRVHAAVDAAGR